MTKESIIGTPEERKHFIGGSDFSTVMDINPYKKYIELCLEKAGIIASTFEGNEATRRGERLEDTVIKMFEKDSGLTVGNRQDEFIREKTKDCLELRCHVDGITSDDSVFEAKTTDVKSKTWANGIPEGYQAQLEFNCYLSKKSQAYIAVAFCDGDTIKDFKWFLYKPKMKESEILQHCMAFTSDIEYFKNSFDVINNGQIIQSKFDDSLIEELSVLNEKISKIKAQAKEFEDKKKIIEDKIKKEIGKNLGFETDLFKVIMGNRITSPSKEYKISRTTIKIEYKKGE